MQGLLLFFTSYIDYKNMSISYLTIEALQRLKEELYQLKNVERPKASKAIAEARDKGDLSENAEYDAAKDAQGLLELRIAKLEDVVANSRIIDESKIDLSKVAVMSKVKILNHNTKKEVLYTLVAESEADLKTGKISVSSPIGKGLLGKKIGEIALVQVPVGTLKLEVLEISR
jgi:transcription elongation factor GreA